MPITLSGTRIRVEYEVGDPKGNSWGQAFNMADVIAASDAGGWGCTVIDQVYSIPYTLYIAGAETYFSISAYSSLQSMVVIFCATAPTDVYQLWQTEGSHIKIGTFTANYVYPVYIIVSTVVPSVSRRVVMLQDVNCYNVVFNNIQYFYIYGTEAFPSIVQNVITQNIPFGLATDQYVTLDNVQSLGGSYGLTVNGWASAKNLFVKTHQYGLIIPALNVIARNVNVEDSVIADTFQRCGNSEGKKAYFIDSKIDKSKMWWYTSGSYAFENKNEQFLQTTLSIYVRDEDGVDIDEANIKIYGSEGTLLLDTDTIDGEALDNIVTYFTTWRTLDASQQIIDEDSIDYEPFRIVISKSGYKDTIINGLTVMPGDPTNIHVSMTQPTYAEPPEVTVIEEPTTIAIIEVETE